MEYAQNPALGQNLPAKPMPELGRLKAATERVAMATTKLDLFIERFHGPRPEVVGSGSPPGDNYRDDLTSLFGQIERLEAAAAALETIG